MSSLRRELRIDDPLAAADDHASAEGPSGRLRSIPVQAIDANPSQPRRRFDEPSLAALAESIRQRGVLQPVIVRPVGDRFELVAGERRWRACQLAGQTVVPALINPGIDDAGSLELALIENLVREDLSPIEQARTFSVLLDDLQMTAGAPCVARRTQPPGCGQHGPASRAARRSDRPHRHRQAFQGAWQGAAGRARPSPPSPARPPCRRAQLVSPRAGGRHRP